MPHSGIVSDLALELIPLALAVALSPFPLVPVVLLLLTARPLANGGGFLAGWLGGLAGLTVLFTLVAGAIQLWDEAPTWAAWTRLVLGVLIVALGLRQWLSRGGSSEPPGWMAALGDYTPLRAARLGLLLAAANPKSLLLVLAGGVAIGAAELGSAQAVLVVTAFAVGAASTVALPVVLRLLLGERMVAPLQRARGWLVTHNESVVAIVVVVIGVMVASKGWSSL